MEGTFPATAGFQDSNISESSKKKKGFEMDFECDFSPFWIQTITWSEPYSCEKKRFRILGTYILMDCVLSCTDPGCGKANMVVLC